MLLRVLTSAPLSALYKKRVRTQLTAVLHGKSPLPTRYTCTFALQHAPMQYCKCHSLTRADKPGDITLVSLCRVTRLLNVLEPGAQHMRLALAQHFLLHCTQFQAH
jgi:hypothetical protein